MKTLKLTRKDVNKVVNLLSKNQVVGVPTDTLMGLMITSDSQEAFDLLVEVKNRPLDKQFPMMFSDLDMLEKYVELSDRDRLLIKEFLPGKVTFVFKVKNINKTVAARIVDNDFLIEVVRKLAKPIYLTSANKSGETSTLKANEVLEVFDNQIAAVVMEDALGSVGSSIIDLSNEEIIILREGEITLNDINDFLKKKEGDLNMRDNKIFDLIEKERLRQENNIELIASENFVSDDILEVTGSILTNKYAEGYPNRRYYGGCQFIDEIEQLAIDRLKELYNAEHANVQPHSGSQANMAVYIAILEHGDTVLGMDLSAGGHLTHGHHLNFSGKLYNFVSYSVDPATETIDYDEVLEAAKKHKPKLIVAGASAYARYIDFKKFREIADEVGAYLMVDMAHIAGMVAAGLHPDPVAYADFVTSTTHKTLRGPRGGIILCKKEHAKKIDSAVFPGTQGGPLEHVIAAKAICFYEALQPEFKDYQNQVLKNAKALAKSLEDAGFRIVSGGTDNHIVLVDVKNSIGLDGHTCELLLDKVNITCNKNMIPFDKEPAMKTSGIRVGSPAMTSRGLKEKEFELIGKLISITLKNPDNEEILENVRLEVRDLVKKFPIRK